MRKIFLFLLIISVTFSNLLAQNNPHRIVISDNHHFLQYENGEPFFWLGDTGWFLFSKLNREEVKVYLKNRKEKGFNVIQCMVISSLPLSNIYGDSAFVNNDISKPLINSAKNSKGETFHDYWSHIDYIIDEAAKSGIYIALVPIWGTVAKQPQVTVDKVKKYIEFLSQRFRNKQNIFWVNGGDIRGDIKPEIWNTIGNTIKMFDTVHLITYHPFGRTQSSTWFHNESWLDFNMFQSGHRRYDQTKGDGEYNNIGEDNYRYVLNDYSKIPSKPTLDGEPSYENIPQGLHDTTQPYWNANDCRRYAYWSVFAGAFGHTYGNNAVMQMYKGFDSKGIYQKGIYGVKNYWYEAIDDSGSFQMQYVAKLIKSRPYFERIYDSTLVTDQGKRYNYIAATRDKSYAFFYTFNGRPFSVNMGKITGKKVRASWYNPRNGSVTAIGNFNNTGIIKFIPPGNIHDSNDWVLILDDSTKNYPLP
jgi:hypothetical protein